MNIFSKIIARAAIAWLALSLLVGTMQYLGGAHSVGMIVALGGVLIGALGMLAAWVVNV